MLLLSVCLFFRQMQIKNFRWERNMLQIIEQINTCVNNFIWGIPAMICIIGVGLYLSIRTRFIQIRRFPLAVKTVLGRLFRRDEAGDGSMTPFQAVCTALAGTVGTGNIAGVAGAIAIGGPGAVFWMWCSAFLGMCTKFAEVTLAVHFRERNSDGDWVGGPMYYIKNGLHKRWHWLAAAFSVYLPSLVPAMPHRSTPLSPPLILHCSAMVYCQNLLRESLT